MLQARACL